jgi:hypothetical protein
LRVDWKEINRQSQHFEPLSKDQKLMILRSFKQVTDIGRKVLDSPYTQDVGVRAPLCSPRFFRMTQYETGVAILITGGR